MRPKTITASLLWTLLLTFTMGVVPAQAERAVLVHEVEGKEVKEWLITSSDPKNLTPPPEGQIEGACGLAVAPSGSIYVSDYYHRFIHIFSSEGTYQSQIKAVAPPGVPPAIPPEGPCGLAIDTAGNVYSNYWHESVVRLKPSLQTFDKGKATGVAVDGDGDVYVNDRTFVAVYEPSGAPRLHEGAPLRIGLGSLGDAYGVAVDPAGKRVYVPDAATNTVKVYEPALDPSTPKFVVNGPGIPGFVSLVDAGVAVDPTNGNLLVADNLKPLFEHPEAAIYEFTSSGAFVGRLAGKPIHGEPTGLAVDPTKGNLFVTTGNSEMSNVFAYGPYVAGPLSAEPAEPPTSAPGGPTAAAGSSAGAAGPGGARRSAASASEIVQRRGVRVRFDGKLTPRALPRHGAAPVGIAVDAEISATGASDPPQLRRIAIAINRHGHFDSTGLARCSLRDIQPSTTANALEACRDSLVGEGHFSADVKLPEQSPFPSEGKVLAFNGRLRGKPAILAHIYGTQPVPTSYVLPFLISGSRGAYGTVLEASLPQATGNWGYVTGLRMTLRRSFNANGRRRSYLTAACPAPAGFPSVVFPLARTSFDFAGGMTLVSILSRNCRARG